MKRCGHCWPQYVIRALVVWVPMVLLMACGYKDKPIPPQHAVPRAIQDLQVEVDDQGATFSWGYPDQSVAGRDLDKIDGFELYRAEIPVQSYCPTCPVPYTTRIALPGGLVPPEGSRTVTYEVKDLRPGYMYVFMVRSKTGWWTESQDSNEVSFLWQTPPAVPQGLTVAAGDGSNTLQWQPVVRSEEAGQKDATIRYQIYRAVEGGKAQALGEPVAAGRYTDEAVENGKAYTYQIQAVTFYTQGIMRSGLSEAVQVRPEDRTAPPVPGSFEGLRTAAGVKLFWEHVESGDLAGYRLYRRTASQSAPTLIGEVLLPLNIFTDTQVPAAPLFYSISSFDTQNPANESPRSREIYISN